jgi:hypothetical protein
MDDAAESTTTPQSSAGTASSHAPPRTLSRRGFAPFYHL